MWILTFGTAEPPDPAVNKNTVTHRRHGSTSIHLPCQDQRTQTEVITQYSLVDLSCTVYIVDNLLSDNITLLVIPDKTAKVNGQMALSCPPWNKDYSQSNTVVAKFDEKKVWPCYSAA